MSVNSLLEAERELLRQGGEGNALRTTVATGGREKGSEEIRRDGVPTLGQGRR